MELSRKLVEVGMQGEKKILSKIPENGEICSVHDGKMALTISMKLEYKRYNNNMILYLKYEGNWECVVVVMLCCYFAVCF